jgi:ribosomal protein S2
MAEKTKKTTGRMSIQLPTVKEMLEAGAHFGHETKRWNPDFSEYIYIKRENFHIIDLEKTLEKLEEALKFLSKESKDKRVLFDGLADLLQILILFKRALKSCTKLRRSLAVI